MTYPVMFELIDELVKVSGSTPPEPGAQLIVVDDDGGAMLCEVDAVSVTDDGWGLELRNLPWPDGWSIHEKGDGHELHRPTTTKEDDQ
mgnify:CR=1 FL=1